ncbi:ATP-binding protein [Pontiellaceae bacterium B12227]|nr:ATP-binding protein [Pontiellaceae bacterium B12227]
MKEASSIFQSVTTLDQLLSQFSTLAQNALHARSITLLELNDDEYIMQHSASNKKAPKLNKKSHTAQMLTSTKDLVSIDTLSRIKETKYSKCVIQEMTSLSALVAAGIFQKGELIGILLVGSKKNGGIYDRSEQDALQILCNQFAVALENARLYTKMQDSKIQNEIMLDQLVSGVIVANPDREITLFNHEAQSITGINDKAAIGQNIAILPREIYLALEVTLENKNGVRNIDASLFPREDDEESSKNIRMGSAFLFGHDGKPMGALLVFTDVTELKGLEEQVRRSDQLSSVGTLAAGMAHEIKNPLVTIKTFTQLLPQRYADDEFRNDFSALVAHEVSRIDGIVNELLSFSKPAKPHLIPMDIQTTIDQTLKLIHEQLSQKNITLKNNCRARKTEIFGDAKLFSQVLINLTLNATEAIGEDGNITIGTTNCTHRFANGDQPDKAITKKCIRLQISDSGKGIEREHLQKIFDPFFTNKSEGTGMGLSVAHGIITEHHGIIEVESEPGRGTTFYIYIPILEEGAVA